MKKGDVYKRQIMKFEKIDITKENINPFQRIGQDWMLISAERCV